jgi:DNA-3-methyladenine glycosylase II
MKKALSHLRAADPVLAAVIERVGPLRIDYVEPGFPALLRAIVAQQVSTRAAATVFARLESACGGKPTPEALAALSDTQIRAVGLSGQKSTYARDLAAKTLSGEVDFHTLSSLPDHEVIAHLTAVKGIGVWTAQMFLIFALRRPDVFFPVNDLGLRNAIQRLYRMRQPPKPERMLRVAAPWRPYCSIACWYLWRSLDGDATL